MKRISRRDFLRVGAGAVGAGLLAACAPTTAPAPVAPPAATTAPAAPAAPTTAPTAKAYQGKIVIMSAVAADQNQPLINGIQDAHPGVTVDWRGLSSEKFTQLFAASQVAGDQIDLMDLNGQDLRRYAVAGVVKDLSDIDYKDRFRPIGLATYTINGKLWALPRGGISGFTYFYNKKVLDQIGATKVPETYDDLVALTPALQKAGIAPFVHPGKNIYLWPIWQFWAFAQTSKNNPVEDTIKTLNNQMKFTDPEQVGGLDILAQYTKDKMFINSVNSMDRDGAFILFSQQKALFYYEHIGTMLFTYRGGSYPDLDMQLIPPLVSVKGTKPQLPGGTGSADCIYAKIAPERMDVAQSILDLMTNDQWVKWANTTFKDPVSCNKNVTASDDPLAVDYGTKCADLQFTYLDWYWPPEITTAFQQGQQAIVAGTSTSAQAADSIQKVMDGLYSSGYKFQG